MNLGMSDNPEALPELPEPTQATTPAPPGHNYVECSCGPREGCTAPCDRKLRKAAPEAIAKATGEQQ